MKRLTLLAFLLASFGLVSAGCTGGVTQTDPDDDDNNGRSDTGTMNVSDTPGGSSDTPGGKQDTIMYEKWADSDKDGRLDRFDTCPMTPDPMQTDTDGDGVGDKCDNKPECANQHQKKMTCADAYNPNRDRDGDGVKDVDDNCLKTSNANQKDTDGDGIGDACEVPASQKVGTGSDSDKDGLSDNKESMEGTNPGNADSDGDGMLDGTEVAIGTNPTKSDKACASEKHKAEIVQTKAADIIFSIDTSGSMSQEIAAVERNINQNFSQIIQNQGIDHRVIMIARRGNTSLEVCIDPPLGGGCGNTKRFKHLDTRQVQAGEKSMRTFLDTYPQYSQWLRKGVFKNFVAISDEAEQSPSLGSGKAGAQAFDRQITAKSQAHFGTTSNRNYTFHSIVGVAPKGGNQAYQPNEPIVGSTCSSVNSPSDPRTDEWISKMTGGLRYPVCNTSSYDAIFKAMASQTISKATGVGCAIKFPKPSSGMIDNDKIAVQWTPKGASQATVVTKVHKKANCNSTSFYVENGEAKLCSSLCKSLKNTKEGQIQIFAECKNCNSSEEICDYKDNNCNGEADEGCEECGKEQCDGQDNDCDGEIDEGCCMKAGEGESCSKDSECCNNNCLPSGKCGPPCRPEGKVCSKNSHCCSGTCAGATGNSLGQCVGG